MPTQNLEQNGLCTLGIHFHIFARFDLAGSFTGTGDDSRDTGIITFSVLCFLMDYATLGV